ncbi:MAG: threonyl-tRNA synthetase [Patescibacteria group bacterium]|nr:threonyl-tRNA synthetase [Patescibacteria group bacterium]
MENNNLFKKRHSLAHILLMAVKHHFPHSLPTIGPVIENGFYYDIDFSGGEKIKPEDLPKLEKTMCEIIDKHLDFKVESVPPLQAEGLFRNNPYKLEIIEGIKHEGQDVTLYYTGEDFFDLCEGPHIHNTKEITKDSFKLDKLAGAYWRGDEKNQMLTRIYGLAFDTKEELASYEAQLEEAKKRDHKKLGVELDLFSFSPLVGPGLPLWSPRGTLVRNLLDDYVWELRKKANYERVEIPHITKKELYITSGHWDKFKDELFRITTREGHEFAMKPMNCPHHTQIYARKLWSYKELPQRYANSTTCYRDEQTGELSGLSRVRAFTQDDAHVFCRMVQAKEEFLKIWDIVHTFYKTFGFELRVRISKHDPKTPEKYLGDKNNWAKAEEILTNIAQERKADYFEGIGEAAFYGPKLDFMAKDAIGREWQVATIQLDMNMPERFDLTCVNDKGERERIVMIHAAIMGSIERFMSILIEHTGGNFPLWLSPVQVAVIPIGEKHHDYAKEISERLKAENIRVTLEDSNDGLGKKVRSAKEMRVPYWIVIGDKDIEANKYTLESRDSGQLGQLSQEEIVSRLTKEVKEKQ